MNTLKVKVSRKEETPQQSNAGEIREMFAPGRYLVYSRFNERDQLHIREYGVKTMSNGMGQCEFPTKKGVCLTLNRVKLLRNKIDEIDEHLTVKSAEVYKTHLGAGIYASVGEYNGVDLRRYWIPEGKTEIVPTKRGIFLPTKQWESFKEKFNAMLTTYPGLGEGQECFHQNQMELIDCRECLPFGWMM